MSDAVERPMPAESRGEAPGRDRLKGRRILVVGGGQDARPRACVLALLSTCRPLTAPPGGADGLIAPPRLRSGRA